MATTAELITQLYVGYYNRAPDPEGLNYWIGRANAGVSMADIANSFAASPEAIATYPYLAFPNVANAETFLEQVYQNLFNRSIDADGREYYANKLATGQTTPGQIIAEIQANANTNPNNTDGQVLANKVTVGLDFALEAASTPGFEYEGAAVNQANTVLDNVTDSQASVDAALASNDTFFEDGVTTPPVTLTTGIDVLQGGTGNDTFVGSSTATAGAQSTVNLGDSIDGGAGFDTVRIATDGTAIIPTLKNVERVEILDTVHDSRDISGLTGVTEFELEGGTAAAATADTTITVAAGQTVSLDGVKDGDATDDAADKGGVIITSAGSVTSQSIALNNVGAANTATAGSGDLDISLTGAGVTTLNVASTGTNFVNLATATATKTVNISGNGSLTVDGALANTVTTVDASTATGSVDVALGNGNLTFKGGAGNDTLRIALADLNAKDSLNGGAGNDTLVVGAATATAVTAQQYALLNGVAAFETIAFNADAALTIDASLLNSASIGAQNDDGKDAITVTNLATADTVVAKDNGAADDTVDVSLILQSARQTADPSKYVENGTVNVSVDKGSDASVAAVSAAAPAATESDFATLKVSGAGDLTFDNSAGKHGVTVDASASTGVLTFTSTVNFADVVTLGGGKDVVDVFTTVATSTYAATDTINGFGAGDHLVLNGIVQANDLLKFDATSAVSFEQAINQALTAAVADANAEAAWFTYGGDTFVVQDITGTAGALDQNADLVVKLTGIVDLTADANGVTLA